MLARLLAVDQHIRRRSRRRSLDGINRHGGTAHHSLLYHIYRRRERRGKGRMACEAAASTLASGISKDNDSPIDDVFCSAVHGYWIKARIPSNTFMSFLFGQHVLVCLPPSACLLTLSLCIGTYSRHLEKFQTWAVVSCMIESHQKHDSGWCASLL